MYSLRIFVGLVAFVAPAVLCDGPASNSVFTMCVPEMYWKDCVQMMKDSANKGIPISCVSAASRYECLDKVALKEADVVAVDPEDMYIAAKHRLASTAGYNVVEQVRTKEEPEEPYRYEAVAVIHKDLNVKKVSEIRGLKSCHTGVGRNVGYKIPITKLTAMGILKDVNNPEYSARENELRALSSLFSKGCLVGTWSPDPAIDQRLKETYSNMCALCEKPKECNYPDIYSGYEGALRCLAHHGGDIAWTKVIYVKRFFGLPVGVTPAVPTNENPSDFRYLCPDGTKVAIDKSTKPCTWAARPWQGYMTNNQVNNIQGLQEELTKLSELGEKEKAPWREDLMLLNEKTLAVPAAPETPLKHLKDAKYLDVIERNSGAPERDARWCTTSKNELEKCRAFSKSAYSRDVRPRIECLQEKSEADCLKAIQDDGADITVTEGGSVQNAIKRYNAKPIVSETYGSGTTKFNERPAIAVVKKTSPVEKLADLKGKKSCHSEYRSFGGWKAPVRALKKNGLVKSEDKMTEFFEASCAPGAPKDSKLCQQCAGNADSKDDKVIQATKCKNSDAEAYRGGLGALKCLTAGKGDVAFLTLDALMKIEGSNSTDLKTSDLKLLCPNGGTANVEEWQKCNLGLEPPRIVLSSGAKSVNALEELTHGILAGSSLYSKHPDLFDLFGNWGGEANVIFKNDAENLASVDSSWDPWNNWSATQTEYNAVN